MTCPTCLSPIYRGEIFRWEHTPAGGGKWRIAYDAPDGGVVLVVVGLSEEQAKAICDQHNLAFDDPEPLLDLDYEPQKTLF